MMTPKALTLIFCIIFNLNTPAHAGQASSRSRGELLYSTHCHMCHTSEIHWRKKNLATDWNSLKIQVNRWQSYVRLDWKDEDINDVTLYLNLQFYHFLNTDPNHLSQGKVFD